MSVADNEAHSKRVRGIEPPPEAWEASVLPLNYTREVAALSRQARWLQGSVQKSLLLISMPELSPYFVTVVETDEVRQQSIDFLMLVFGTPEQSMTLPVA